MGRGPGPREALWPVTPAWRQMVRDRMAAMGLRPADLARLIGTSNAQISLLFKSAKSSGMVPRVHRALKLPPPGMIGVAAEVDALKTEIDENWKLLADDEKQLIAQMIRVATKRRPDQ